MSETTLPADHLAALIAPETQRLAARMAQDGFATLFRRSVEGDPVAMAAAVAEMQPMCLNWAKAAGDDEARATRLALLVAGLDQWGLAYTRAFELAAIPSLSMLLGGLRASLDAQADAQFGRQLAAIDAQEGNAIDFKVDLRRGIHMALWHAMAMSEEAAERQHIAMALGSLLLSLTQAMPQLGWRLVADALAHMQLRLLGDSQELTADAVAATADLTEALRQRLTPAVHSMIFQQAAAAVLAWQRARKGA